MTGGDRRTDAGPSGGRSVDTDADDAVEDGRYLYCLVSTGDPDDTAVEGPGVDGADPYLVTLSDAPVGAVVHACDGPYDADDPDRARRLLVAHQGVVDRAADRFGTPLPFRFDVVVEGGDRAVREWLADHREAVADSLRSFADRREYRVQLLWTDDADAAIEATDDRLADLRRRRADADGGASYLLDRQYEQRLSTAREQRRHELVDRLHDLVDPVAVDTTERDRRPLLSEDDRAPLVRLAVLADRADEDDLGERLDRIAAEPDVYVRFTGPWPPYSFAPSFDADSDSGDGDGVDSSADPGSADGSDDAPDEDDGGDGDDTDDRTSGGDRQ